MADQICQTSEKTTLVMSILRIKSNEMGALLKLFKDTAKNY